MISSTLRRRCRNVLAVCLAFSLVLTGPLSMLAQAAGLEVLTSGGRLPMLPDRGRSTGRTEPPLAPGTRSPPKATNQEQPPAVGGALPVPLVPAYVGWLGKAPPSLDPWNLFDGDRATALASRPGVPVELAVTFQRSTGVSGMTLLGPAEGILSIFAQEGTDRRPLAGLTKVRLRVKAGQWKRIESRDVQATRHLVVEWVPSRPTGPSELAFWGYSRPGRIAADPELADRILSGGVPGAVAAVATPSERQVARGRGANSAPTDFEVTLGSDPRGLGRAFLVYELSGVGHWREAVRQINGLPVQGGFRPEAVDRSSHLTEGGLQVEEVSPAWLRAGRNQITFSPISRPGAPDYRVRNVRIVATPHAAVVGSPIGPWPGSGRQRLFLAGHSRPHDLVFAMQQTSSARVLVSAPGQVSFSIPLGKLQPGWHRIPLDRLGATQAVDVSLLPGRRRGRAKQPAGPVLSDLAVTATPVDERPLVVSHPLHGECVDHQAYVRGFVASTRGAVELRANGSPAPLSGDGSFALTVAEPARDRGRAWAVELEAVFPGGRTLKRTVPVGPCLDSPVRSSGLAEDEGAPFGEVVRPNESKIIAFGGARLEIPAGSVDRDVRITVRPLVAEQVPPLSPLMANVSAEGRAFRFGPHGLKFKQPIKLTLPYDAGSLRPGMREQEIQAFYFDEDQRQWNRIGRYGAPENGELASLTEHFTDFVNATLAMPDQPGTKSFNPNEMNGIQLGRPSASLGSMAPPEANAMGTAEMKYPVELPPGRRGVEPALAFGYSSARGNGWLGVGWDVRVSSIEIDTSFGVPRYDGTEVYLLDGDQLTPTATPNRYARRVEGRFDRIQRDVDANGCVTSWTVTDKNGTVHTYGATGAVLADPANGCRVFRWGLASVQDTFGNQMKVSYFTDQGLVSGEPFVELYPQAIGYTSHVAGLAAHYQVAFVRDAGNVRPDVLVSGRPGFQQRTRFRLDHIDVRFQTTIIRRYQLTYQPPSIAHFHKSLLASIALQGVGAAKQLDQHTFDYAGMEVLPDGTLSAFAAPEQWGQVQKAPGVGQFDDGLARTESSNSGGSGTLGFRIPGIFGASVTAGGNGGSDDTRRSLFDLNGDGLPDPVDDHGNASLNFLRPLLSIPSTAVGHLQYLNNAPIISLGHTDQSGWSASGDIGVFFFSGGVGYTRSSISDRDVVTDLDGDGFPDLVHAQNGALTWSKNDGFGRFVAQPAGSLAGVTVLRSDPAFLQNTATKGLRRIAPIVRWTAPYTGFIEIQGAIQKVLAGGNGVVASLFKNGSPIWRRPIAATDLSSCVPGAGMTGGAGGPNQSDCGGPPLAFSVQAGDRIYTKLEPFHDPAGPVSQFSLEVTSNEVLWDPVITYTNFGPVQPLLREPYGAPILQFSQRDDFRLAGQPKVAWMAASDGTVAISGDIVKQATSDEVKFEIVRVDALNQEHAVAPARFPATLGGGPGALPLSGPAVIFQQVAEGDQIVFRMSSDTPIDPAQVTWRPVVEYTSYCRVDPETRRKVCGGPVTCDTRGCTFPNDPAADVPIPIEAIVQPAQVQYPVVQLLPATPTPTRRFDTGGTTTVVGSVFIPAFSPGRTVVLVQGVNRLFSKQGGSAGDVIQVSTPISFQPGDQVFVTIYSDQPLGIPVPSFLVDGSSLAGNLRHRDASFEEIIPPFPPPPIPDPSRPGIPRDPMAGGFHRWFNGFYNGELAFNESQIVFPLTADGKPLNTIPTFNFGVPGRQGLGALTEPLWLGPTANTYVGAGRQNTSRAGFDGDTVGSSGGLSSLRSATNWNLDFRAGASLGITFSAAISKGRSNTELDFFDFNGDRRPDVVTLAGVLFGNGQGQFLPPPGRGLGAPTIANMDPEALRRVEHRAVRGTVSIDPNIKITQRTDTQGRPLDLLTLGFNVGHDYSMSVGRIDWLDVNGDGLPDLVQRDVNDKHSFSVQLNYGYGLSQPLSWATAPWAIQRVGGLQESLLRNGTSILDGFTSEISVDQIRLDDTGSNNVGAGVGFASEDGGFNVGGGVSYGVTRTIVDLADINGDGLPDQLMKRPNEDFLRVRLNLGDRFDTTQEVRFLLPDWGLQANTGLEGKFYQFLGPNGNDGDVDDALQYRRSKSYQFNTGFKICFFICVGASGYQSSTSGGQYTSFQDVDGDGYADQVLKVTGGGTARDQLWVKRNLGGGVNLLRAVHGPTGGNYALDYAREGNLVRRDLSPMVDEPGNKYVLAKVDIDDGRGNHYLRTISYDPTGFHDRVEREDYGFSKVTVARLDGSAVESTTETQYHNQDFYRRGLVRQTAKRDATNKLFAGQSFVQADPATVTPPPRTGSFFPKELSETTSWYEGLTTDFNTPSKTTTSNKTWDGQGNLTDLEVLADVGTADDVLYHVDFDPALAAVGIFRPRRVTARDRAGTVLRDRIATYESHGALATITQVVIGGKEPVTGNPYTGATATNPTWTLTYDAFGNVIKYVDPRGYTLDYVYDTTVQTYRTSVTDSFSLKSLSTPNFFFGAIQATTDVNGQMQLTTFDEFGRISTVSGPNDIGATEPTIAFAYSRTGTPVGTAAPPRTFPAFATTSHKDGQRPGNPIVNTTFVDGLDRVVQTKKDHEKDTGTATVVGMIVSGAIEFDGLGRVKKQGQPIFDTGPATAFVNAPMTNPTVYLHDVLDRGISTTGPDGSQTTTLFGFDTIDGVLRMSTTVRDPNVNAGGGLPGAPRQTFSDARGLTVAVKESNRLRGNTPTSLITRYVHDPMSQLTKVTDAKGNITTAVYDTVGRMVAVTSPDSGKTEWRYDRSGNLGAKQTARLAKKNQTIQYQYDFNRLKKVDYPTTTDVVYRYGASTERGDAGKNLAGRLKQEISEAGGREYQYDRLGNVIQTHWALESLQSPTVAPYERTMSYTYDSFARLLTAKFPDDAKEVVSYGYDQGGNVTRVVGVNSNPGKPGTTMYVTQVGYDEFGQRTRLVYGNGIQQTYKYDPLTRRLEEVNADHRDPALIQARKPARPFERMRYSYDLIGNVTEIRNDSPFDDLNLSFVLTAKVKQNFVYDDLHQLKTADGTYQENSGWRLRYALGFNYDEIGNILKKQLGTDREIPDQTRPDQWRKFHSIHDATYTSTYTYAGPRPHAPSRVDEIIDQNPFTSQRLINYDDSGNQTGWTFQTNESRQVEWNEEDRIHRVTLNGVELSKASYDGGGGRAVNLQVPAAGTVAFYETAYFGQNLTLRNAAFMTKHIFLGDTRIASKMDASWLGPVPTTIYFHDDQLGSTNFLTNDVQELVAHEEYFPSGELWVDEFDRRYPLRQMAYLFNGKELDAATGLYHYGARYYDPRMNIWVSPDPGLNSYMAGSVNGGASNARNLGLYSYTWNNPISLIDPDGRWPDLPGDRASNRSRNILDSRSVGVFSSVSILDIVESSRNLRPRTVEQLAQAGTLTNSKSFLGVVGEYNALEAIVKRHLILAGISNLRSAIDIPELQAPTGQGGFFDFTIAIPGRCASGCGNFFPSGIKLDDAIGPYTGGMVGVVDLGQKSTVLNVEATTSGTFMDLEARALKVGLAQAAFDKMSNQKVQVLGALAIDRGVFFQLTDAERATLKKSIGGGTIILIRDLNRNSVMDVKAIQQQLRVR